MSEIFRRLHIQNWRQFRDVDIHFHDRLTVITGANGAGKTTLLNILSRHFGWNGHLVGTPRRTKEGTKFFSGSWLESDLTLFSLWLSGDTAELSHETVRSIAEYLLENPTRLTEAENRFIEKWIKRPEEHQEPSSVFFKNIIDELPEFDRSEIQSWATDPSKFQLWLHKKYREYEQPKFSNSPGSTNIGSLVYGNGSIANLTVPTQVSPSFSIDIAGQIPQRGMYIPSHRPQFSYQQVDSIPTVPRRRDAAYNSYADIIRVRYYGGHHQRTPNYYLKETLMALAAFGEGNRTIEPDKESAEIFDGFEETLRTVLPSSLGFLRFSIRLPEVVLVTKTGEFSLDAVSGGIASLIDLAWQIYMFSGTDTPFAVTIDEPENHLHPELQRTVLTTLLTAFPHIQFICATHNPFIVTSVPDSNVYALFYGSDNRVISESLSAANRSGSSNEILRDVLGLPSSSPIWVETELNKIESETLGKELTRATINELKDRLRTLGLERFAPTFIAKMAEKHIEDDKPET